MCRHNQVAHLWNVVLVTDGRLGVILETHLETLGIISGGIRVLFGLKLSEQKHMKRVTPRRGCYLCILMHSSHSTVGWRWLILFSLRGTRES